MAMQFENSGMSGVANWFKIQFKEEQAHAEIFMNYINQRGGRVILKPIAAVDTEWHRLSTHSRQPWLMSARSLR